MTSRERHKNGRNTRKRQQEEGKKMDITITGNLQVFQKQTDRNRAQMSSKTKQTRIASKSWIIRALLNQLDMEKERGIN